VPSASLQVMTEMLYRSSMHALLLALVRRISKAKQAVLCVFSGPTYPRSSAAASSSFANPLAQRTRFTLFARTPLARDPWEARTRVLENNPAAKAPCVSRSTGRNGSEGCIPTSRAQNQKILYHKVHVNEITWDFPKIKFQFSQCQFSPVARA